MLALYYAEHLNEGAVPYFDWPVEYPVLTGYFMGVLGLPVHDFGRGQPRANQVQAFYNLNALVLSAFGLAAIARRAGAAPPTTVGRGDVRARPGAAWSPRP